MKHLGFLQFEDEGISSRTEGSLDFNGPTVVLRVGDNVVAEVDQKGFVASAVGDGSYRLTTAVHSSAQGMAPNLAPNARIESRLDRQRHYPSGQAL